MSLAPGTRLGSYQVIGPLGAGGMGEVYRAHDTTLGRDVALKILPESFAGDADRRTRFEREARTLAAVNHPNIAAIYGVEGNALVMELVEGEDLSALIARRLTVADAIAIAKQIAEALEAAHELGIIHRDLKPANVKVRADGTVKVLDFGLAKAIDPADASGVNAMHSPTLTARATAMGVILGTAAYMAPEQAKGKAVDKRVDVWAFGVVLYEMLTGAQLFDADTVPETLAHVITRPIDLDRLPAGTPARLRDLIARCLERDPRLRLRDIGEARLVLSQPDAITASVTASPPVAAATGRWVPWLVAASAAAVAIVFVGLWWVRPTASPTRIEAAIAPPPGHQIGVGFALAPAGDRLVMEAWNNETGMVSLWLRDLDRGVPVRLTGTDGGTLPFWSPDGSEIAFFADGKLKTTNLEGSPPQVICDAPSPRGGAWGPDNTIVFAGSFRKGLERVDAGGGTPTQLTTLDEARGEKSHRWPVFLPRKDTLLFVAQTGEATSSNDASTIEALALSTGARTRLVTANSSPVFSPAGFLLFWREGALRAQAFDADRLTVSGNVFPVAAGVAFDSNELAQATVAANGALVYSTADTSNRSNLLVVDRSGRTLRTIAQDTLIEGGIALSHDDARLAAAVTAKGARDTDIWIYDLERGTAGPLTFEAGGDRYPSWSANDAHVLYANDVKNDGILFRRSTDGQGQAEQVAANVPGLWSWGWSRDGAWLLAGSIADATSFDILRYDVATKAFSPIVNGTFNEHAGALSPDDRWVAYQSDETGRFEVYVRALGPSPGRWQISTQGGTNPRWRADGRELYFLSLQGHVMAVDVDVTTAFKTATPRALFRADLRSTVQGYTEYAPFRDGQRFVINALNERGLNLLTVVTDWPSIIGQSRSRAAR